MLKGMDPRLSPEVLCLLARMGHGDSVAVVDANYPAYSMGVPVLRMDGLDAAQAVEVITSVMPLDRFVEHPVRYMVDKPGEPLREAAQAVMEAAEKAEGRAIDGGGLERMAFYDEGRKTQGIIVTAETRSYGDFLLTKGTWPEFDPD